MIAQLLRQVGDLSDGRRAEFAEFLQAAAELRGWRLSEPSRPEEASSKTNQRQEESSCRHRPPLGSGKIDITANLEGVDP